MTIAALFILMFFTVYAASCFVTCGKLFSTLFGAVLCLHDDRRRGRSFCCIRSCGGFLAESASDFMQAIVDDCCACGGRHLSAQYAPAASAQSMENAKAIPGFLEFFGTCHAGARTPPACRPVASGVARRSAQRRELRPAERPVHACLGARLLRHAAGAPALHGDPPRAIELTRSRRIAHGLGADLADRRRLHRYRRTRQLLPDRAVPY